MCTDYTSGPQKKPHRFYKFITCAYDDTIRQFHISKCQVFFRSKTSVLNFITIKYSLRNCAMLNTTIYCSHVTATWFHWSGVYYISKCSVFYQE